MSLKKYITAAFKFVVELALSSRGYRFYRLPYSRAEFTVYKLIRDERWCTKTDTLQPGNLIRKAVYFGHDVFYQKNDLRAYFTNELDEEATRIYFIYLLLKLAETEGPLIFFDLGANYGTYSLAAAELDVPSVLLEPNPFLCACLTQTFPQDYINVMNVALVGSYATADEEGEVPINIMPTLSGGSSARSELAVADATGYECFSLNVGAVSFDNLLNRAQIKQTVAVLKLDIEGLELSLFNDGLLSLLKERFSKFILFVEYVPDVYRASETSELRSYLTQLPSIILSDRSYKMGHRLGGTQIRSFGDIEAGGISAGQFYDLKVRIGEDADTELQKCKYADVVLFSDEQLASYCKERIS